MTTDPETRALTAESEALLDRIHILNGRSFPLATREDFAAIEEAARRADRPEARVAEGLTVEALAAALRDARKRSGMTLRDASRFVEVHFSYLSKVENGHERPGDYLVMRLCNLYGTDPEPLLLARAVADVPEPVRAAILANLPTPRPPEPDRTAALRGLVERVASMGLCSQTHHEHLLTDARRALRALAATPEPAPVADGTVEG